ncbi:mechanosensitive ion channel family protein [Candidatus Poseidoniaceae archaeon]|nr:mechanosensitive ion channel family protein [Candidatus Poseidoniaceae archaeon]
MNPEAWVEDFLTSQGLSLEMTNYTLLGLGSIVLFVVCFLGNFVTRKFIVRGIQKFIKNSQNDWDDILIEKKVFNSLSTLVPLILIQYLSVPLLSNFTWLIPFVHVAVRVSLVLVITSVLMKALKALEEVSKKIPSFKDKPIVSYIQLASIMIYVVAAILIIATILDKDPLALLGALGALTAVLMLVFKDTILGLVASIQISSNDMVRVGDWVSMPKYGTDGDVLAITLNTVKIQNWDKTISTIPTYAFISDSFKNWRGMTDSKGRRIKRSLNIDMTSIKFCTDEEITQYKGVEMLKEYIEARQNEITTYNEANGHDKSALVNGRNLTNIGLFREYAHQYLSANENLRADLTLMVRQLEPTENGLPIEVYCFSNNIQWVEYERIQADIFDHLLSSLPNFNLEIFQNPTGKFGR